MKSGGVNSSIAFETRISKSRNELTAVLNCRVSPDVKDAFKIFSSNERTLVVVLRFGSLSTLSEL